MKQVKYLVIVERTATGFSAYSPDLPGCVTTGSTENELRRNMQEAIEFHLDGLRAKGCEIPVPVSTATSAETAA